MKSMYSTVSIQCQRRSPSKRPIKTPLTALNPTPDAAAAWCPHSHRHSPSQHGMQFPHQPRGTDRPAHQSARRSMPCKRCPNPCLPRWQGPSGPASKRSSLNPIPANPSQSPIASLAHLRREPQAALERRVLVDAGTLKTTPAHDVRETADPQRCQQKPGPGSHQSSSRQSGSHQAPWVTEESQAVSGRPLHKTSSITIGSRATPFSVVAVEITSVDAGVVDPR